MYRQKERAMRWHQVQQVILLIYIWIIHENIYVEKIFWIISCLKKTHRLIGIHSLCHAFQWRLSVMLSSILIRMFRNAITGGVHCISKCRCAALRSCGNAFLSLARVRALSPGGQCHRKPVYNHLSRATTTDTQLTTGFHMRRLKKNKEKVSTRFITCVRQFLDTYFTTLTMFVNCKFIYY